MKFTDGEIIKGRQGALYSSSTAIGLNCIRDGTLAPVACRTAKTVLVTGSLEVANRKYCVVLDRACC